MELGAGEVSVERWRANHSRGRIAVGGRLWLTNQRLVFEPHGFESGVLGRTVWSRSLADVTGIGVAPRGCAPFSGAWRRRLAVHCGPTTELFVVDHVEGVVDAIAAGVRPSGPSGRPGPSPQ